MLPENKIWAIKCHAKAKVQHSVTKRSLLWTLKLNELTCAVYLLHAITRNVRKLFVESSHYVDLQLFHFRVSRKCPEIIILERGTHVYDLTEVGIAWITTSISYIIHVNLHSKSEFNTCRPHNHNIHFHSDDNFDQYLFILTCFYWLVFTIISQDINSHKNHLYRACTVTSTSPRDKWINIHNAVNAWYNGIIMVISYSAHPLNGGLSIQSTCERCPRVGNYYNK